MSTRTYLPAATLVAVAGVYLLALGVAALAKPNTAKRFLESHASSARAHFFELALRLVAGTAFVLAAPVMKVPRIFALIGWVLIVTTVVLCVVPWRVHQRFARWSVPMATRNMAMLGVGSLVGGICILAALLLP